MTHQPILHFIPSWIKVGIFSIIAISIFLYASYSSPADVIPAIGQMKLGSDVMAIIASVANVVFVFLKIL